MKRVRYLLGLSSPAEREHIELEYFEDDDAFQEMLTAEDDFIDAYVRGELADEERQRFEKTFVSSLRGRNGVQFARAFAGAVSTTRSVETKRPATLLDIFKSFQSPGLSGTATIAAVIVFVAVLAWLFIDRRRMTNELRALRAESAELSKRTEVLQRSNETERTRAAEIAAQFADLPAEPDKPRYRERVITATQRTHLLPDIKNDRAKIASGKPEQPEKNINTQDNSLANAFESRKITELPLDARNVTNLLTLQPATIRERHVAGGRADQANITLDGVDLNTYALKPRNISNGGGTTVRGTVKDPQGNVVSGATVTLTDPARNFTRTHSTNEDGAYVFNAIPPGTYSVEVQAPGFKTVSVGDLAAFVDTSTVDVQLEAGAVSETITVTAGSAEVLVNPDAGTLGNTFVSKTITELPVQGRHVTNLLSLQPAIPRDPLNHYLLMPRNMSNNGETTITIASFLSWIRFQMGLETAATHEDYRVTIKTADGRPVTSVDWSEPLTPNQTLIDTPVISTGDLPSGDYVLLLMGKEPDGSFVKVAEYSFKVIKY